MAGLLLLLAWLPARLPAHLLAGCWSGRWKSPQGLASNALLVPPLAATIACARVSAPPRARRLPALAARVLNFGECSCTALLSTRTASASPPSPPCCLPIKPRLTLLPSLARSA